MSDLHQHTSSPVSDPSAAPMPPTVWPSVGFTDMDAGLRLLTEGFGFVVTALYRSEDGTVDHAEARWPDGGGVMFGSRGKPGPWGSLGPQGIYIVAAEHATVDAAWERLRQMPSVDVLNPLADTDYGSHQFDIRDSDGNLWCLGTYRGV